MEQHISYGFLLKYIIIYKSKWEYFINYYQQNWQEEYTYNFCFITGPKNNVYQEHKSTYFYYNVANCNCFYAHATFYKCLYAKTTPAGCLTMMIIMLYVVFVSNYISVFASESTYIRWFEIIYWY